MTPAALRRLSVLGGATPPVASATRHPVGGATKTGGAGVSPLTAPEGDSSSRVTATPELLPAPYTQRLQLLPATLGAGEGGGEGGGEGSATLVASGSGAVTAAGDPESGDGMENLTQQVGRGWLVGVGAGGA